MSQPPTATDSPVDRPAATAPEPPETAAASSRWLWPLLTVVLAVAIPALRLIREPRFFYSDDTERGSAGQWYELGEHLLRGEIPILNPSAWQAGNYWAEGQWGLFNPLQWIIAVTSHLGDSPVLHATIVKLAFLGLLGLGVYLLAREFGSTRPWAALAGISAPQIGFLLYMAAASWSTDLFNIALLPWVWWSLRRAVEHRKSPLTYLVFSYLLITFGYVFGVLMLVAILVESLVRQIVRRDGARIVSTLVASMWGALLTVAMFLPAVLTAPVTERGTSDIENLFFLNADLTDLASSANPWVSATIRAWDGDVTPGPLVYLSWLLVLFPLALPMSRQALRRCVPLLVIGSVLLLFVIGPSHLAALRWPLRMIPYLGVIVLVIFAVAISRAFPHRVTKGRVGMALILVAVSSVVTWGNGPYAWKAIGAVAAVMLIAIAVVAFLARSTRVRDSARTPLTVAGSVVLTVFFALGQMYFLPTSPLPSRDSPDSVAQLSQVLPDDHGSAIVVGQGQRTWAEPDSWRERLLANLWYFSKTEVSSLYTVLPFQTYTDDLCVDLRGETCKDALDTLWSIDESTGARVSDLADISTIVVMKATVVDRPTPPNGWTQTEDGDFTWVFERDQALPDAGGVSWTGDGTRVSTTAQSDTSVTFTVDDVGEDARVVLSRLPYPGYAVSGAELTESVRGWLLTVDVADVTPGESVTVTFRPPGLPLILVSFAAAAVILIAWPIAQVVVTRRNRRSDAVTRA